MLIHGEEGGSVFFGQKFGPQKEMNMNSHRDSSSLLLRARSSSAAVAGSSAGLLACLDDDGEAAALSFTLHVVAPSRAPGAGAARAPPTRPTSLTLIAGAGAAARALRSPIRSQPHGTE
ncbi:hypothetical protein ABZP36_026905 [Zizania latifolia]